MMSRSAVPSQAQVEMLVDCLEDRRWHFLATGHARTGNARVRTRVAWQEIAVKLNSEGSGCIKTSQQWAKYWKDKKAAVKRKVSSIRIARQATGGGAAENIFLSTIEEKIMAIMGGEGFAIGDRELEVNPFHPSANEHEASLNINVTSDVPQSTSEAQDAIHLSQQNVTELENEAHGSESILQGYVQSLAVEPGTAGMLQTECSTPSIPDVQPGPSWLRDISIQNEPDAEQLDVQPGPSWLRDISIQNEPDAEQLIEARRPPTTVPHRSSAQTTSSPRRRRLLTTRRRLLQRSPPSQRQSQLASLTERFIAIEEGRLENEKVFEDKRLENQRLLIDNQKRMFEIFMEISRSWSRQTQALQDLCASTRALVENANRN